MAVGYQMTAIPILPGGRVPGAAEGTAGGCGGRASCSVTAPGCGSGAASCGSGEAVACAPGAAADSRSADRFPVASARTPRIPGWSDDPFRCETCNGCPVWCAVPFLNDFRAVPGGPALTLASRLREEPRAWDSLILDLLTPPPKPA